MSNIGEFFSKSKNLYRNGRSLESPRIDHAVFRLHYRVTTAMFFVFSVMVGLNKLIGEPINCVFDQKSMVSFPGKLVDRYCWIQSTFTLPQHYNRKVGGDVASDGVGPGRKEDTHVYHAYYQWVVFVLFFQGILFYVPHWLWKIWEGKKLQNVIQGMRGVSGSIMKDDDAKKKRYMMVNYLQRSLHSHNSYALSYILCDLLNLVNVVGNLYLINAFLGGVFLKYGAEVIHFQDMDFENRTDPMVEVFPRLTKCTFHYFGPSGGLRTTDALCVLALNIINEKIYIILWFWLILLAGLTFLSVLYRFFVMAFPMARVAVLQRRGKLDYPNGMDIIVSRCQFGDFFLLALLSRNLSSLVFNKILSDFAEVLDVGEIERSDVTDSPPISTAPLLKPAYKMVSDKEK